MIKLVSMNGVALKVGDIERSREWYGRHFGFEHKHDGEGCEVLGVDDIELTLSPHDKPDAPLADPRKVRCIHTLAFEVTEAEFDKAKAAFEAEDDDLANIDQPAYRSIITSDPDDYCVELYCNKNKADAVSTGPAPRAQATGPSRAANLVLYRVLNRALTVLNIIGILGCSGAMAFSRPRNAKLFSDLLADVELPMMTRFILVLPLPAFLAVAAGLLVVLVVKEFIKPKWVALTINIVTGVGIVCFILLYSAAMHMPHMLILDGLNRG